MIDVGRRQTVQTARIPFDAWPSRTALFGGGLLIVAAVLALLSAGVRAAEPAPRRADPAIRPAAQADTAPQPAAASLSSAEREPLRSGVAARLAERASTTAAPTGAAWREAVTPAEPQAPARPATAAVRPAQPASPIEAEPAPEPTPPLPDPILLNGEGATLTNPIEFPSPLNIAVVSYQGSDAFSVTWLAPDGYKDQLISGVGPYQGQHLVSGYGGQVFSVEGSGSWTIEIQPLAHCTAPAP